MYGIIGSVKFGAYPWVVVTIPVSSTRKVARLGDTTYGYCSAHGGHNVSGVIISSASITYAEGKLIARIGDIAQASCGSTGTIDSGVKRTLAEGSRIAGLGDSFSGTYSGTITSSAETVTAG